ncbi:MAG: NifB/NifX family molybdenum-iron cluster-binding protein [Planctomycetes bacterium]|nr:NifB/NifX family molybdenum-iron cluster-binding protein [Planctomycetota bacterium]
MSMQVKVAIPVWDGRISPVFDVARHLLVIDVENNAEIVRNEAIVEETALPRRARRLVDLGVNVLVCGAISWPLEQMLTSAGIRVIAHTCGPAEEVFQAFASGELTQQAFLMPGCSGRRRRFRSGRGGGRGRRRDSFA